MYTGNRIKTSNMFEARCQQRLLYRPAAFSYFQAMVLKGWFVFAIRGVGPGFYHRVNEVLSKHTFQVCCFEMSQNVFPITRPW